MDSTAEPQAQKRLILVAWLVLVWGVVITGRLLQLQVFEHESLRHTAIRQQERLRDIHAARGTIFSGGENGGPLALSVPIRRIAINPLRIGKDGEGFVVEVLAELLHLDRGDLMKQILDARRAQRGYLVVKEDATSEEISRLRRSRLDIFTFEDAFRREYPKGSLASHVLGWTNRDGRGDAGVEMGLEDELRGSPGKLRTLRDSRNRDYHSEIVDQESPEPGANIYLTIDEVIQFAAEQALRKAVEAEHVPSGTIVVMRPKTGDILAMASYPSFNPTVKVKDETDMMERLNLTIGAPFEPGSVFKVVTVAAALETTRLRPGTVINCGNGVIHLAGRVVHDHDAYPALSVTDVLAKSSNIGAINIGLTVGNQKMHEYMRRFGFGDKVNIPLPGESGGLVRPLRDWEPGSMGSVAMGHEMMATPLQLAQAFSIIANTGVLIRPRLVQARQIPGHKKEMMPVAEGERRLKPETAIELRRMLEEVVLSGTAKHTVRLKGYTSAGKTGTAQMVDHHTGKYLHRYNGSFVGFAPVANPEIVVAVTLNGTYKYGGESAGPVFNAVANIALRTLGIPKDLPDEEPVQPAKPAAAPPQTPVNYAANKTPDQPGLDHEQPAEEVDPALLVGPRAPDFTGMTLRAVLEKSAAEGWRIDTVGRGIARVQEPQPGAVSPSRRIRVVFGR